MARREAALSMIEAGHPQSPALLLLHGFPMDSREWLDLIPVFAARFRVIAVDLFPPGWSDMDDPAEGPLGSCEAAVRHLLDELGVERAAVVGRGFGGAVALRLASSDARVESAVLIDSVFPGTGLSMECLALRSQVEALDPLLPLPPEALAAALVCGGSETSIDVQQDGLFDAAGGTGEFVRQLDAMDVPGNLEALEIDVPVLLLWGEEDRYVPAALGERLSEAIPSSTLGLLPGCGHFLVQEAGRTIGPIIHEYLRGAYLHSPHGHQEAGPVMVQLGMGPPWEDLAADEEDDWFDVDDEED